MLNVFFSTLGEFIWSFIFLPGLLCCAVIYTIRCRGLQFRRFGLCLKNTVGTIFRKNQSNSPGISSFQAASSALGSTVGTGNIIGTAQAIAMGGPGALFWLWLAALISMIVKYAEIVLAIHYRKTVPGYGPMDYIEHGLSSKKLAVMYGFMALLSSFGMGNLSQASSIADSFLSALNAFVPGPSLYGNLPRFAVGFLLAGMTLLILSGGMKRIGRFSSVLVPFMVIIFIAVSFVVIICNISHIPAVLKTVFREAFSPGSLCSGVAGLSTSQCIQWGLRRSAFSNEAGLGTSAIAHATAETESAAKQGLWGIFEVFADTIVICSCTSLCILCSGIDIPWGRLCGAELFCSALGTVFGLRISSLLVASFLGLFAYTSIIGWALYGCRCSSYLWGEKSLGKYKAAFVICLIFGCTLPLSAVWQISDIINAFMSVPNLIALIFLSPTVIRLSKDSFS